MSTPVALQPLLSVDALRKSFGGVEAVRGVSFDVRLGQLVALIGTNGAGKTTTFNCINGQLRPDSGKVFYNAGALTTEERMALEQAGEIAKHPTQNRSDDNITGRPPRRITKLGIGRTFQITATFASMTVLENIQMVLIAQRKKWRRLWGVAGDLYREEAFSHLETVGLAAQGHRHVATLAYGDLKRLELAMALACQPKLLLMDEPTAGMGIGERDDLMRLTHTIARKKRIGVLFTEHDTDAIFNYADWIIVMHRGEVLAKGTSDSIKNNVTVREAYLGKGNDHA
ncbi:MAG: ABC transporter ATP-binding protein [Alphaproteobacteria bacterium]|nr:ABC transporter ATP-binding protein [Alphaproteobacteria bacterium]